MITNGDITETAFYLFAETGFHETSMENIADALGLKKQSLYSHFRSKNELILAVLREQETKVSGELDNVIAQHRQQPVELFIKSVFFKISILMSHRERLLLWKRLPLYTDDDDLRATMMQAFNGFSEHYRHKLSEALAERCAYFRDPKNLNMFMLLFLTMLQGYTDVMLSHGFSSETAELIWNAFWNGVRTSIEPDHP